ncbi:Protein TIFY 9 [Acorus calamus]|uniref:Protein TIFY 9 n=1 Tax=Acorus calamus TaxID=4465 RepID=A0AAV9F0U9_ACOCL|nr:Protein TIFY 9 [Acorus calamus]
MCVIFFKTKLKAEKIIKSAEDVLDAANLKRDVEQSNEEDLPIARRRSLRRFLEKRKGRLICVSPYEMGTSNENGKGLDLTFGTF